MLDFFAGSGTTGAAALELGSRFVLVDDNPEALAVMARRFDGVPGIEWIGFDPRPHRGGASADGSHRRLRGHPFTAGGGGPP